MAAQGWNGPVQLRKAGDAQEVRVRDCTQARRALQVAPRAAGPGALTGRDPQPSMPRNLYGAPVADATPSFLPRGSGRFQRR